MPAGQKIWALGQKACSLEGGGGVSGFQNTQLSSFQNSDNLCARRGPQRLEVMSLEAAARKTQPGWKDCSRGPGQARDHQALRNSPRRRRNGNRVAETWGRLLGAPLGLCPRAGAGSLCPENVPLKGVTVHLTKWLLRGSPSGATWDAPLHPPRYFSASRTRRRR